MKNVSTFAPTYHGILYTICQGIKQSKRTGFFDKARGGVILNPPSAQVLKDLKAVFEAEKNDELFYSRDIEIAFAEWADQPEWLIGSLIGLNNGYCKEDTHREKGCICSRPQIHVEIVEG